MKIKDFRVLVAELGLLTPVQRSAVIAALSSKGSAGDVVALIEAEFAKAPACGHCGSEAFSKWGVATGMKRYTCKACERDLQRAHRRAAGPPAEAGEVARLCPRHRRRTEPEEGSKARRGASGDIVSLASPLPVGFEERKGRDRHRYRGSG